MWIGVSNALRFIAAAGVAVSGAWQLEATTDRWLLEDGTGVWLLG